jgi:hypothetical protein
LGSCEAASFFALLPVFWRNKNGFQQLCFFVLIFTGRVAVLLRLPAERPQLRAIDFQPPVLCMGGAEVCADHAVLDGV